MFVHVGLENTYNHGMPQPKLVHKVGPWSHGYILRARTLFIDIMMATHHLVIVCKQASKQIQLPQNDSPLSHCNKI